MFLVLVFQAEPMSRISPSIELELTAEPMNFAALLVGILQAVLVEVAADAGVEAAAVFTELVGAMRHAEALQALSRPCSQAPRSGATPTLAQAVECWMRYSSGLAIGAVADADVFPVRVQALALGKAGAAPQCRTAARQPRKSVMRDLVFMAANSKPAGLNPT